MTAPIKMNLYDIGNARKMQMRQNRVLPFMTANGYYALALFEASSRNFAHSDLKESYWTLFRIKIRRLRSL